MKTRAQICEMFQDAKEKMDEAAVIRNKHYTSGETLNCDYFKHWTGVWEYHRGRYYALLEVLNDY